MAIRSSKSIGITGNFEAKDLFSTFGVGFSSGLKKGRWTRSNPDTKTIDNPKESRRETTRPRQNNSQIEVVFNS
jgi:hypothetical protein